MTAVVFSGGGLFGAYQLGAWRVLAKHVKPDLVVGASIGSLNGWMVAGGASPREMEQFWRAGSQTAWLRWRRPRTWRDGVLDPGPLHQMLQQLHRHFTPRIPYACVMRRLPAMRAEVVRTPNVTWRHLAASCALPLLFDAQHWNGRTYIDGGVLNPLPLFAARQLGATRIIGINCMPWGGRWVRAVRVQPKWFLGTPRDLLRFDPGNHERWLAQGAADAEQVLDRL
jgi:NTE family protein